MAGIPDVRGSPPLRPAPLVPGMWNTSVPKFVPTSGGTHSWSKRVRPRVPSSTRVGESVHVVHNAFMASAEHKGNILDPDFRRVGIGVVPGTGSGSCGAGGVWATEDFYG